MTRPPIPLFYGQLNEMSSWPVRTTPDPVLREVCREIAREDFAAYMAHANRMGHMVLAAGAWGLACPQVGVVGRMFVFRTTADELWVAINPHVEGYGEMVSDTERCLSIPDTTVIVPRYEKARLEAQDPDGDDYRLDLSGQEARVVQHEFDHLNGVLISDRALSRDDILYDPS